MTRTMQNDLLRRERLRRGWTQYRLAVEAAISQSTVERAERGEPLRIDSISLICTCLGKQPEELGFLPFSPPPQEQEQESTLSVQGVPSHASLSIQIQPLKIASQRGSASFVPLVRRVL